MKDLSLTAVFVKAEEGGYVAYIAEMDGVNTQGETLGEAKENLKDALMEMLEMKRAEDRKNNAANGKNIIREPFMALS